MTRLTRRALGALPLAALAAPAAAQPAAWPTHAVRFVIPWPPGGLNDLIAGRVQLSFDNIPPAIPHIRSGKLRALAVTASRRSALLPDVPTAIEAGLAGFDVSAWFGLLAPAGTPREAIQRVHAETAKALQAPELRDRLTQLGFEVIGSTPEAFGELIRSETVRWAKIIRDSGARVE